MRYKYIPHGYTRRKVGSRTWKGIQAQNWSESYSTASSAAAFTYFPTGTFAVVRAISVVGTFAVVRASSVVGTFAASPSAGVVAGCNIVVATSIY